ncbi:MAG: hypothetical protein IT174_08765 [Acidobacteria bacterium]|nr:hypothetical protein [Acidobacteriota bacterium]
MHNIRSLVEVLNRHFVKESDDFCRDQLLDTLGALADESSLPIFEYLMRKTDRRDERRILLAAKNYVRPEFKDYLSNVFESDSSEKSHRIFAAWGLAKLGNCEAYEYLVMMLDDPEKTIKAEGTITYDPGQSVRAAQAISDINGWNFTWGKSSVDLIRVRLSSA